MQSRPIHSDHFDSGQAEPKQADLRQAVSALASAASKASFRLALRLHEVLRTTAYRGWGYETFEDYLAGEVQAFKPQYLASLVRTMGSLDRLGLLGAQRDRLEAVGIARARVIARAPTAQVGLDLLSKASGITVTGLENELRAAKAKARGEETTWMRFSVDMTGSQFEIVTRAMRIVGEVAGTTAPGRQLELMAAESLATWGKREEIREEEKGAA